MIRRLTRPSPGALRIVVTISSLLTLIALVLSVRVSVSQSADRAGRDAVHRSLCEFYDYQRSTSPPPTTARGRVLVERAEAAYHRLHCP